MKKPVGSFVVLRAGPKSALPPGERPEPGDCFITSTGRKYLILEVEGRRFDCVVVRHDHPIADDCHYWKWYWRWPPV